MPSEKKRILILCKTYPSPSAKYTETSCVAGMDDRGNLIRLYPVPFRLIDDDQQFKKWQWIETRVEKSRGDRRPESHKLFVDTIQCEPVLSTTDNWRDRREWLDRLNIYSDFSDAEAARASAGNTLALVRPAKILGLEIRPTAQPDWTPEETEKLLALQQQGDFFNQTEAKSLRKLRKIPFDFHYRYQCETPTGPVEYKHKIVDWEIGALYWNVHASHGKNWEEPMRRKWEFEFSGKDLIFLMGTIHRFPDQWLIVSVIYPPKQRPEADRQSRLF